MNSLGYKGKGASSSDITHLKRKLTEARSYSQTDKKRGDVSVTDITSFRSTFNTYSRITGSPLDSEPPPPPGITILRSSTSVDPYFYLEGDGTIDWGNGEITTFTGSYEGDHEAGNTITILSSNLTYADLNNGDSDIGFTSIVCTECTALEYLYCNDCEELTSLNVSGCTALEDLDCSYCTSLEDLDVSGLNALQYLDCAACTSLEELDVSGCGALFRVYAYDCALTQQNADIIAGVLAGYTVTNGYLSLQDNTPTINTSGTDYDTLRGRGWYIEPNP